MSLNPGKMLNRLFTKPPPTKRLKHTLLKQIALNYILLESSFPKDTKLYQFNAKFASELHYINDILIY